MKDKWEVQKKATCLSFSLLKSNPNFKRALLNVAYDLKKKSWQLLVLKYYFSPPKIVPLISIEYPKAATANHNQYFRRDTRFCPIVFVTNKQTQRICTFLCFCKWKTIQDKQKGYHSWIGKVQAKLQWRQNAIDNFLLNFLKLSPFCEILSVPANRAKGRMALCSLTPISLNLSPLNYFQTL